MRKTLIYVLLLAVVGAAVYYFVFADKDAFGVNEAGFNIEDTASVDKIFLADKGGNSILLERKPDAWYVNEKYKALPTPVEVLLGTMHKQMAMSPVPNTAHDNVIKLLAGNAIKVEVYNGSRKIRVFYVGGEVHDAQGTYMLVEGAKTAYVVQIPGFSGYVAPRYSTQLADWRDRIVFNIPPSQLKTASVKYADTNEVLNSFTFTQDDKGQMNIMADEAIMKTGALNKRRTEVFSTFFEKIYCEGFINGVTKLDSVIRSVPRRCTIEATSKTGDKQMVDVYWMPITRRSKNMLTPNADVDNAYDADRFYAVGNNFKDTMIIQRGTFEKIFRKAYEFYQADDAPQQMKLEVPKGSGNVIKMPSGK